MTTLVLISEDDFATDELGVSTLRCTQSSSAKVAAHLRSQEITEPLILLAGSDRAAWLPAIALSQRAQGRRIAGYLVIDPIDITTTNEWPDAPVIALISPDSSNSAHFARLRGWHVLPTGPNPPGQLLAEALDYLG
ncbi:MAG: hypothetical protein RJB01_1647 [Actinomycetota bacterium]